MTNPLQQGEWLASLRTHYQPVFQLLGVLLTEAGPRLTMAWLDVYVQQGPRTAIPGLHTSYDALHFAVQHEALIEMLLAQAYKSPRLVDFAVARTFGVSPMVYLYQRPSTYVSRQQQRRRRCRLALYLAVAQAHRLNLPQFVQARIFEQQRTKPFTPFLP